MVQSSSNGKAADGFDPGGLRKTFANALRTGADPATINALSDLLVNLTSARSGQMSSLLDPRRDVDNECGYPASEGGWGGSGINVEMYRTLYDRHPIACRAVELMPKECWQVQPKVYEDEDPDKDTDFERDWDALGAGLRGEACWYQDEAGSPIWEMLRRADIRSGIGHFGILLLGVDDGKALDQPLDGVVSYAPTMNTTQNGSPVLAMTLNSWDGPRTYPSTPSPEIRYGPRYERDPDSGLPRLVANDREYTDAAYDTTGFEPPAQPAPGINALDTGSSPIAGMVGNAPKIRPLVSSAPEQGPADYPDPGDPNYGFASGTERLYDQAVQQGYAGSQQAGAGYGSGMGTDAQYVGVQLGPSEYPAGKDTNPTPRRRLLFMRVYDESLTQIVQCEANIRNPRFGLPVMYRVTLNDPREQHSGIGLPIATVRVHWSRVVHLADNLGSSETFGVPRMRPFFDRLLDLRKIYGADGESFWKNGLMKLVLATHPQLGGDVEVNQAGLKDMMENFGNSLQPWLSLAGMDAKPIAPAVVDPTPHLNAHIEAICICLGCPKRVFCGSERGELASSQDDDNWNDRKRERQNGYLTPRVIIPLVDRLIACGVLSPPKQGKAKSLKARVANALKGGWHFLAHTPAGILVGNRAYVHNAAQPAGAAKAPGARVKTIARGGYSVEWPAVDAMSKSAKATVLLTRTQAYAAYVQGNLEAMIPPHEYMTQFDDRTDEEAGAILDAANEAHDAQETMTMPPMDGGRPVAAPPGSQEHEQAQQKQGQFQAMLEAKQAAGKGPPGKDEEAESSDEVIPAVTPPAPAAVGDYSNASAVREYPNALAGGTGPKIRRITGNASFLDRVREAGDRLAHYPGPPHPMPGYGQVYWNAEFGTLWYVGGDGDDDGWEHVVKTVLGPLLGEGEGGEAKVQVEAEHFPKKEDGWRILYPVSSGGGPSVASEAVNEAETFPTGNARDRFYRPENYNKVADLPGGEQLWAGANDWEAGWTWAWVQGKDANGEEPNRFWRVDHSDCPGCDGDPGDESLSPVAERICQQFAKTRVAKWAGVTLNAATHFSQETGPAPAPTQNADEMLEQYRQFKDFASRLLDEEDA